ncbi:COX12 [Candida oxycetoniae]|uniref:Cytochrome c oxidase subunit 12, mitochondrial n=1 Tax=Candida oxycetoniae TaxID=497107 RepID=A0AAI9SXN0_9ASCO|nr:COX12 [Candida oxycetoniae]KAI3404978.2 COX12 [Candida oxycetoniae]
MAGEVMSSSKQPGSGAGAELSKQTSKLIAELVLKKDDLTIVNLKISRNDSMKSIISKSLDLLTHDSILFEAFARDIPKMISIVEIVKQKKSGLHQYNRLFKYSSEVYPYMKKRKEEEGKEGEPKEREAIEGEAIEGEAIEEDRNEEEKINQAIKEVKGSKVYDLPVLYIILSNSNLGDLLNNAWTVHGVKWLEGLDRPNGLHEPDEPNDLQELYESDEPDEPDGYMSYTNQMIQMTRMSQTSQMNQMATEPSGYMSCSIVSSGYMSYTTSRQTSILVLFKTIYSTMAIDPATFKFDTPQFDPRFPNQNQSKHCAQSYIDYHKCVNVKGEDFEPCQIFFKTFTSLCPLMWIEKWDDQRSAGTFPVNMDS